VPGVPTTPGVPSIPGGLPTTPSIPGLPLPSVTLPGSTGTSSAPVIVIPPVVPGVDACLPPLATIGEC
jgi:hypothetical protein